MLELWTEETRITELRDKMDRVNRTAWRYEKGDGVHPERLGWSGKLRFKRLHLSVKFELHWNSK